MTTTQRNNAERNDAGCAAITPTAHADRLNDPDRLAALDRTGVMDSLPEDAFDRVLRLATHIIGVPVGLVSFVDAGRQYFKAHQGVPPEVAETRQTPLSHSFCQYVVSTDAPLVVEDARQHPLVKDNLAVPEMGVIAYLGVPIHAPDGQTIGSLCAIDMQPRSWSGKDIEVLDDLTAMLETELRMRQEHQSMHLLAHELNHRVKNLFAVTGSMISMTARSTDTSAEMAEALQGRLTALSWAHEVISPAIIADTSESRSIGLAALIARLVEPHLANGSGQVRIDVPGLSLNGRAVADMALVIHELATNAAKYGALSDATGRIDVSGSVQDDSVLLVWEEQGGPEIANAPDTPGFGSKLIAMTLRGQLGGDLDTEWRPTGVCHRLQLPRSMFDAD